MPCNTVLVRNGNSFYAVVNDGAREVGTLAAAATYDQLVSWGYVAARGIPDIFFQRHSPEAPPVTEVLMLLAPETAAAQHIVTNSDLLAQRTHLLELLAETAVDGGNDAQ